MPGNARIVVPLLACVLLAALALASVAGIRDAGEPSAGADVMASSPVSGGSVRLRMSYALAADEVPKAARAGQYGGGTALTLAALMLAAFAAASVHARILRRVRASEAAAGAAPEEAAEGAERVGPDLSGHVEDDLPERIERDAPAPEPGLRYGLRPDFEDGPPIEAFGEAEDAPIGLPPQAETIERLTSLLAARDLEVAILEKEISDWQEAWRHAKPRFMEQNATIEALQAELAARFGGTALQDHAGESRHERSALADSRFAEDVDAWIETFMSTPARQA